MAGLTKEGCPASASCRLMAVQSAVSLSFSPLPSPRSEDVGEDVGSVAQGHQIWIGMDSLVNNQDHVVVQTVWVPTRWNAVILPVCG